MYVSSIMYLQHESTHVVTCSLHPYVPMDVTDITCLQMTRLTEALQPCGEVEFYLDGDMVSLSTWMSQEVSKWLLSGYNPNIPHL